MARISELRKRAGYPTQQDLAQEFGISRATVAHWESGRRYPRAQTLPKLAELLHCTERDIVDSINEARFDQGGGTTHL